MGQNTIPEVQAYKTVAVRAQDLFEKGVVLRLACGTWGNKRDIPDPDNPQRGEYFRFIDGEAKELRAVQKQIGRGRAWLAKHGSSFWAPGMYLIHRDLLNTAIDALREIKEAYFLAVEEFVDAYPRLLKESVDANKLDPKKGITEEQAKLAPHPSTLFRGFYFNYSATILQLPNQSTEELESMFSGSIEACLGDVSGRLRKELRELLGALHESMTGKDRKKFYESVLTNITEWVEALPLRNFSSDMFLTGIAGRSAVLVKALDFEGLKKDREKRLAVGESVQVLLNELESAEDGQVTVLV
jgi:hypothetical protein